MRTSKKTHKPSPSKKSSIKRTTKKRVVKKPIKKLVKKSKAIEMIECPMCAGMGKRLIRKHGIVKVVRCKGCAGEGEVLASSIDDEDEDDMEDATLERDSDGLCEHGIESGEYCRKCERDKLRAERRAEREERQARREAEREAAAPSKPGSIRVTERDIDTDEIITTKKLTDDQQLAKETIEERAAFFGCPGKVVTIRKGPVITLYEFKPAKQTRIQRLRNLQEDLALALSAEAVMVRRIPSKNVMGIEISNDASERQNVGFRQSLKNVVKAKSVGMSLPLNLGTDPFGDPIIDDLATMPHLLIAGTTGSGKSVSLNCIISSLITVCSPDELQFYMIDPKGVELTHYNGIPHMRQEMVTSSHRAKEMLESLSREMRHRLQRLTNAGVRDIVGYNALAVKEPTKYNAMPRIIMVIDELGDLMIQDKRWFTQTIAEISQIARATGIHIIAATQRPSVDVLSGRIKVNFPGRMAFKVTSMTDSRVIINRKGAEGLLGRGDMLYASPTRGSTLRIHAPWVPLEDVVEIADKIRKIEADRLEAVRVADEKRRIAEQKERLTRLGRVLVGDTDAEAKVDGEEDIAINIGWAAKK